MVNRRVVKHHFRRSEAGERARRLISSTAARRLAQETTRPFGNDNSNIIRTATTGTTGKAHTGKGTARPRPATEVTPGDRGARPTSHTGKRTNR